MYCVEMYRLQVVYMIHGCIDTVTKLCIRTSLPLMRSSLVLGALLQTFWGMVTHQLFPKQNSKGLVKVDRFHPKVMGDRHAFMVFQPHGQ